MKQIINGKRYDTETADLVASWDNIGHGVDSCTDFAHVKQTLYRTKKGAWFILGAGGPLSPYAWQCGKNSATDDTRISALTDMEARAWLEEKRKTEELEKYFPIEDA